MFDEIPVMDSRGPMKYLLKYLHLYHFLDVIFHLWKFHGVLDNVLSPGPEKGAQNPESIAQNYLEKSLVTHIPCCGSDWRILVTWMPMSRERLRL